jgi:hypothetical protein
MKVAFLLVLSLARATEPCDCLLRQFNEQICDQFIATTDNIGLQSRIFPRANQGGRNREAFFCEKLRTDIQNGFANIDAFLAESSIFQKIDKNEMKHHDDCHICWDGHDETSLKSKNCGHVFHSACLKQCVLSRPPLLRTECPICRHDFLDKSKGDVWKPTIAEELGLTLDPTLSSSKDDDDLKIKPLIGPRNRGIFGCIKKLSDALCCTSINENDVSI